MQRGFDLGLRGLFFDAQPKPLGELHADFLDLALTTVLEDHCVKPTSGPPRKLKRKHRLSTTRFAPQ